LKRKLGGKIAITNMATQVWRNAKLKFRGVAEKKSRDSIRPPQSRTTLRDDKQKGEEITNDGEDT